MEDLNKNQIVLLSILISFVTSIATGIMTTSLLQEAPIEVTRNINRIVEKTIETVTTPTTVVTPGQKEVTTVIVKEEDLILDSINKNVKSIVRIEEVDAVSGDKTFYGLGLVVTKEGIMVADRKTITPNNFYTAIMSDGVKIPLLAMGIDRQTNFILFKANEKLEKDKTPYAFSPAKFSDADPKLGQTVISVGGSVSNAVAIGRTVSLIQKDSTIGTTTTKYLATVETDLSTKDLYTGSPLFNLSGDVIGMKISGEASKSFIPGALLKKDINTLSEPTKAQ
jgi:S1-C subfamily serine protease